MARPDKDERSVLRLGQPSSDPNAWRPSKARAKDSSLSLGLTENQQPSKESADSGANIPAEDRGSTASWRPSKVNQERLSSLSPARGQRRFAMPRGVRPALTLVFFVCAAYVFFKLWFMPTAGGLHPALAIAAAVLAVLAVLFVAGAVMRRKRKGGDDQSTLRL